MRKFLFIAANEWPNWGGSELLWMQAAERMARRGVSVRVSVPDFGKGAPEVEQLRLAGCRMFYRRGFPPFLYRLGSKVLPLPVYNRVQLRSAADGVELVVISQGSVQDGLPWADAAQAEGFRYALIIHGVSELWWPADDQADRLAQSFENAARSFFVSEATVGLCRRQFAVPLLQAKIVRNPFNVPYDARPAWPTEPDELSLACVARLDGGTKGHDLLLQVLALPHWRQRGIHVTLVGKGTNERMLRRMAENLRLDCVEFAGHINNIEEVWSKHHALVLPSRFEGMPITVVEAMLCGRPCIATDVGGVRELVRDGINGFIAKAPTIELVDEAMGRAWDRRSSLREMGEIAAGDVRGWVSKDPIEDFIREVLALAEDVKPQ
jgi:glycosyltransferase involved in cell wall biosynthesis